MKVFIKVQLSWPQLNRITKQKGDWRSPSHEDHLAVGDAKWWRLHCTSSGAQKTRYGELKLIFVYFGAGYKEWKQKAGENKWKLKFGVEAQTGKST